MQPLVYVSNNCIGRDCKVHPFLGQERDYLLNKFGNFVAISSAGIFSVTREEITAKHLTNRADKLISWIKAVNGDFFSEILHMLRDKKLSPKKIIKVFRFTKRGVMLERFVKKSAVENPFLYSYWVSYDGYAVARYSRRHKETKTFARAHAFDIQLSRNDANPYLMKRIICKYIDKIAFISKNGYEDFLGYYQKEQENFTVCHIGSKETLSGFVEREMNDKITMVTCSSVIEIKRLHLMIDALKNWNSGKIKWIHIGDGELFEEIQEKAKNDLSAKPIVEYEFMGRLSNEDVSKVLKREDVNLFVNCSRMEGTPVSIMEAMSVGLPVVAPRVGGIPELVVPGTGFLFDDDKLYDAIYEYSQLSASDKKMCSEKAYKLWEKEFCLEKNNEAVFKEV